MGRFDKVEQMPIYKKADHIFKLIEAFDKIIPEDNDYLKTKGEIMMADIMIISSKIVGAEAGDLYSIRMQNAAIIRDHAMNLYVTIGSFRFDPEFEDAVYVVPIREEIEAFRLLFIDWVKNFNTKKHIWDEWELFNPPGYVKPENDDEIDFDWDDDDDDDDSGLA